VIRTAGPRDTGMRLGSAGEQNVAGTLEITGPNRSIRLRVGQDALADGVLLGRYSRCDGTDALDDPSLSRVHAMLLHVDEQLVMIDTSSSNGMRIVGEEKTRLIVLEHDAELKVGRATKLRWSWSS
jgi:hypothetical protein